MANPFARFGNFALKGLDDALKGKVPVPRGKPSSKPKPKSSQSFFGLPNIGGIAGTGATSPFASNSTTPGADKAREVAKDAAEAVTKLLPKEFRTESGKPKFSWSGFKDWTRGNRRALTRTVVDEARDMAAFAEPFVEFGKDAVDNFKEPLEDAGRNILLSVLAIGGIAILALVVLLKIIS